LGFEVDFLTEFFQALLLVGAPLAVFTAAIVWWALSRGYFQEALDTRALQREIKTMSHKHKKNQADVGKVLHPIQKKWSKFGGGFYGIVALFTYIIVEVTEVIGMIINLGGLLDFLRQMNIGLIVNILVDALMNFISAIAWPWYWMSRVDTNQVWIWFMVAYGGYWLGLKLAQMMMQRRSEPRS